MTYSDASKPLYVVEALTGHMGATVPQRAGISDMQRHFVVLESCKELQVFAKGVMFPLKGSLVFPGSLVCNYRHGIPRSDAGVVCKRWVCHRCRLDGRQPSRLVYYCGPESRNGARRNRSQVERYPDWFFDV